MEVLDAAEKEKAIEVRNSLYSIDLYSQEVLIKKSLPFKENYYSGDIYQTDFYELVLRLNFNKSKIYCLSTILENEPIHLFRLDNEIDKDEYFNLMCAPNKIGLTVQAGLSIITEQILIYSLDASWFLHSDRYNDKTILYSENPIDTIAFWKNRGIEDSTPGFED